MRALFLFVLLNLFCKPALAQNDAVKSTDKLIKQVNTFLKENALAKKTLDHKSTVGGAVNGYYLKNKLRLITARQQSEFGYIEYLFYVERDSLLFVNERKVMLKEPVNEKEYAEYEKYILFNTENGNTDFTKWPLTADISNDYYFLNRKVIKYRHKNFNKAVETNENEVEETARDLISRYMTHFNELK